MISIMDILWYVLLALAFLVICVSLMTPTDEDKKLEDHEQMEYLRKHKEKKDDE